MKMKSVEYETPAVCEYEMFTEGILCASLEGDNESYGPDPDDESTIF